MQLSTSTSAPDSNLLPALPAAAGVIAGSMPAATSATPFAELMPETASAPTAPDAPVPAAAIPGGIIATRATALPAVVGTTQLDPNANPAPACANGAPAPVDAAPAQPLGDNVTTAAISDSSSLAAAPAPSPASARPGRHASAAASAPTRSARSVRNDAMPGDPALAPQFPPPPPAAPLSAITVDFVSRDVDTPTADTVVENESETPALNAEAPEARNAWMTPPTATPAMPLAERATAFAAARDDSVTSPATPPFAPAPAAPVNVRFARAARNDSKAAALESDEAIAEPAAPVVADVRSLRAYGAMPAAPKFAPAVAASLITEEVTSIPAPLTTVATPTSSVSPAAPAADIPVATQKTLNDSAAASVAPRPEIRADSSLTNRPEKFAASRELNFSASVVASENGNKNFLNHVDDKVTEALDDLGIGVAKPAAPMSNPSTARFAAAAAPTGSDVSVLNVSAPATVAPQVASAHTATAAPTAQEITAAAHRAVDAVLASTERIASSTQTSVNLRFSVGDAALDVRVEVRAGEVHATFRTDSPELRNALAVEWQATQAQSPDHSLRIAPPVFAAGDRSSSDAGTAFSGEQSSQARDQAARSAAEFTLPGATRSRAVAASSSDAVEVASRPARYVPVTTLHLHAFA